MSLESVWKLREWGKSLYLTQDALNEKDTVAELADAIEQEHERVVYDMSREFDEWKHDRDTCWVKLPVDADGVPIRVGDVMEFGEHGPVQKLELWSDDSWVVVDEYEPGHFTRWHPNACHHVQPDSWERIIEDAIHAGATEVNNDVRGNLITRCRALAGDGE